MTTEPRLKWPLREELSSPLSEAAKLRIQEGIQARLGHGEPLYRRRASQLFLGAAAAILLMCGFLFIPLTSAPGELLSESGEVFRALRAEPGGSPQTVEFADGSSIEVAPGGSVRGLGSSGQKMLTLLEQGEATFEVRPGGPRQWIVEAGALSVEVVGTRFSVERTLSGVSVRVTRGGVLVRSAQLQDGVRRLEAGASVSVRTAAHADDDQPAAPMRSPVPETQETSPEQARAVEAPAVEAPAVELDDKALLDEAPSDAAPSDAANSDQTARRGTASPGASDLMRASDAARLQGNTSQAIEALEALVLRYPSDPRADSARFQLARLFLAEGRRQQAESLLRNLATGSGPLSEEAYLRLVELKRTAGALSEAKDLAVESLRRYPDGRHRSTMESLRDR